jgi:hypothetical protein
MKKASADIIKSRVINVLIVLGNSNLGLTILAKIRGESEARGGRGERHNGKGQGWPRGDYQ